MGKGAKPLQAAVLIMTACLLTNNVPAWADEHQLSFFDRNAARNVFGPEVKVVVGGKLPEQVAPKMEQPAPPATGQPTAVLPTDPNATPRERILKEFGDPSKDVPVRTVDNAPLPFKGMMAALEVGDDQLAYQFAEQWHRYMGKLQRNNLRAVSILGEAGDDQAKQAEESLKQAQMNGLTKLGGTRGDQELLKEVETLEGVDGARNIGAGLSTRPAIRAALADSGKVPVDAQGKVNIVFFFDSLDINSLKMAQAINALRTRYGKDRGVQIAGIALDENGPAALVDFKDRAQLQFPVSANRMLADKLNVTTPPTVVFMSPTSHKMLIEEGLRSFDYLDEVVMMMQGRQR